MTIYIYTMGVPLNFPDAADASSMDIPLWTTFYCANYSTWAEYRTPQQVQLDYNYRIVLPYPTTFNTLNQIPYTNSPSIQMRGVEEILKGLGMGRGQPITEERLKDAAKGFEGKKKSSSDESGSNNVINRMASFALQESIAGGEMFESFMTGGNVFRMDHTEMVLKPGCRRTHVFEFNLVAKTGKSAELASRIANAFQANAHPGAFTRSIYTMTHPDIWTFGISPNPGESAWQIDGQGLTSVLVGVDINRAPIQNIPYNIFYGGYSYPLATNIKLKFVELEPALNFDGESLIMRSQKDF